MLRPACRRFRRRFEPGIEHPHRRRCAACAAFAQAVESAARSGARLPLPAAVAARLQHIAAADGLTDGGEAPPLLVGVPRLPLPPALRQRLEALGHRPPLPAWVRSSAAGLAASLLLAVATSALVGNPVTRMDPVVEAMGQQVSALRQQAVDGKQALRRRVLDPTVQDLEHRVSSARASLGSAYSEAVTHLPRIGPWADEEPTQPNQP